MSNFLKNPSWSLPLIVLFLFIPFLNGLDLFIERYFYQVGNDPIEHFVSHPVLDFLFNYGPVAANLVAGASACILSLSFMLSRLKKFRPHALVLILTLAIGSGLFINMILKDHWGRPRPKQVEEFGGTQAFRPFYEPNFFHQPMPSRSFPCGHCSSGFFFFAMALVGKRLNKQWLYRSGLLIAIVLGSILSIARMAQGAHFFSDTLFSAIIIWYTALSMDWLVYSGEYEIESSYSFAKTSL